MNDTVRRTLPPLSWVLLADPSYRLLAAGFFVCGFHVAFLATHLPGVVSSRGLPLEVGAWSLAVIGLFNIVGSLAMGWAVSCWRMKSLLSLVDATRAAPLPRRSNATNRLHPRHHVVPIRRFPPGRQLLAGIEPMPRQRVLGMPVRHPRLHREVRGRPEPRRLVQTAHRQIHLLRIDIRERQRRAVPVRR